MTNFADNYNAQRLYIYDLCALESVISIFESRIEEISDGLVHRENTAPKPQKQSFLSKALVFVFAFIILLVISAFVFAIVVVTASKNGMKLFDSASPVATTVITVLAVTALCAVIAYAVSHYLCKKRSEAEALKYKTPAEERIELLEAITALRELLREAYEPNWIMPCFRDLYGVFAIKSAVDKSNQSLEAVQNEILASNSRDLPETNCREFLGKYFKMCEAEPIPKAYDGFSKIHKLTSQRLMSPEIREQAMV